MNQRWASRIGFLALLFFASPGAAQVWIEKYRMRTPPDLRFFEYLQMLTFSGDLRLRNDGAYKRGTAQGLSDRNRMRYRVRFGFEALLPWDLTAAVRLGSGAGEQTSSNQSFDNLSSQKPLWLDLTFLRWSPIVSQDGDLVVYMQSGRMPNSLWRIYSSDMLWDEDLNPEGFAQGAEWLLPTGQVLFANAMQGVADEDTNSSRNQWFFSEQLGTEFRLPFNTRLRSAAAYHLWTDTQRNTLNPFRVQDGNRRSPNGVLLNRFGVAELSNQFSAWAGQIPISIQGSFIRNVLARGLNGTTGCPAAQTCPPGRDGYQFGIIVGEARVFGTWEVGAFQKYVETDATIADVADSNFGDSGINQQGQIFWVAYTPADWMTLRARFFNVDTLDTQFAPFDKAVRRLILDFMVRF